MGELVFTFTTLYFPQIRLYTHFKNDTNKDTQYPCSYLAYKNCNSRENRYPS